jgi:hypothetical protein
MNLLRWVVAWCYSYSTFTYIIYNRTEIYHHHNHNLFVRLGNFRCTAHANPGA